jgi:hypothetical protein
MYRESEVANGAADYPLREKCRYCGATMGTILVVNGQDTVRCGGCGRGLYNAPKTETGRALRTLTREEVPPGVAYVVKERAHFRCEFCGKGPMEAVLDVDHLISVHDVQAMGIVVRFANHIDNLAFLCNICNSGKGRKSIKLHDLLILQISRLMAREALESLPS